MIELWKLGNDYSPACLYIKAQRFLIIQYPAFYVVGRFINFELGHNGSAEDAV
jgi:hypothetical protein